MKCAVIGCDVVEPLETSPCCVCNLQVHHMCANNIHEGELHERYCSKKCLAATKLDVTEPTLQLLQPTSFELLKLISKQFKIKICMGQV